MATILIVDDDVIANDFNENSLSPHYSVKTADSAQEALQLLDHISPDLILLDINMPGKNGYEFCQIIRKNGNQTPVLFLSGLTSLEERLKAYDVGGNDFIAKPASPKELLRKIEFLLSYKNSLKNGNEATNIAVRAMADLSNLGHIINFFINSYSCTSHEELATAVFDVLRQYNISTSLLFKTESQAIYIPQNNVRNTLEETLLNSLDSTTRILEFGEGRAAFNWNYCSLLVKKMPENEHDTGVLKDHIAYLMDGIDQCLSKLNIDMQLRQTLATFQTENSHIKNSIVGVIDDIESQLEHFFSASGMTDEISLEMEEALIQVIKEAREKADAKLQSGFSIENRLSEIINSDKGISKKEHSFGVDFF